MINERITAEDDEKSIKRKLKEIDKEKRMWDKLSKETAKIENFDYLIGPIILYPTLDTFIEIALKEHYITYEHFPNKENVSKYLAISRGKISKKDGKPIFKKGHTITVPEKEFPDFLSAVRKIIESDK